MVYSLPPSNAVMTSLSPATIGEDDPAGTGTFHLTFLSGPNSTGGFWPCATPAPPRPRVRPFAAQPDGREHPQGDRRDQSLHGFALCDGGCLPARRGWACAGVR